MVTCNNCILDNNYPDITFNKDGICSLCDNENTFTPKGEDKLLDIFQNTKQQNTQYDALVPLSGGKDSTYILHLAVNIYKLKVLTITYDNGLLSKFALNNIQRAVDITKVRHIFCKPDFEIQRKVYKNMLRLSGDFCGACDIATRSNVLKVARDFSVPLILYGTSPLENDSFVPDSIQDITRFKHIMKQAGNLTKQEINDFLIFPNLNPFKLSFYKRAGIFSKEVNPLFYIDNPTDKEMGVTITRELGWNDSDEREYSKHLDCIAEPLTNYIRNKIYGYERRRCQYSNMIRRNEITRSKAIELLSEDKIDSKPANYLEVLQHLKLTDEDIEMAISNPPLKYEKYISKTNKVFKKLMNIKIQYYNR
jgi:hypothetical protein